jgi:hypothetical protein
MRYQGSTIVSLRSRVSAHRAARRDRRSIERYLDDSSPSARRELEVILMRHNSGSDLSMV